MLTLHLELLCNQRQYIWILFVCNWNLELLEVQKCGVGTFRADHKKNISSWIGQWSQSRYKIFKPNLFKWLQLVTCHNLLDQQYPKPSIPSGSNYKWWISCKIIFVQNSVLHFMTLSHWWNTTKPVRGKRAS